MGEVVRQARRTGPVNLLELAAVSIEPAPPALRLEPLRPVTGGPL